MAWLAEFEQTRRFAELASGIAKAGGVPAAEPAHADAVSARVGDLVAGLIEPARLTALEKVGESGMALGAIARWLGPSVERPVRT
jgi:hypothetical protein